MTGTLPPLLDSVVGGGTPGRSYLRVYMDTMLLCTDCILEQKCVNCSQPHSSASKQCPKRKFEKEIQAIKTNRNISYLEAQKLIAPRLSQTYAQVAKSSTATSTTQMDENITQIKCQPLKLLQTLLSVPQPNKYLSITSFSASSSTTQANLLPSASSMKPTTEIESRLPGPISASTGFLKIAKIPRSHPYQLKHAQLLQLLINLPHFNHQSPY
ncbi:uncharacterized protein TNCV_1890541 [Trichonephila clavipes]|nr:uncharacterized protein TNCV_1890541 [Trichonephila clavipes]